MGFLTKLKKSISLRIGNCDECGRPLFWWLDYVRLPDENKLHPKEDAIYMCPQCWGMYLEDKHQDEITKNRKNE